jgi:hypothetical protein
MTKPHELYFYKDSMSAIFSLAGTPVTVDMFLLKLQIPPAQSKPNKLEETPFSPYIGLIACW